VEFHIVCFVSSIWKRVPGQIELQAYESCDTSAVPPALLLSLAV